MRSYPNYLNSDLELMRKILLKNEGIFWITSTKQDGSISRKRQLVKANLKKFADSININTHNIVLMKQIHGAYVEYVYRTHQNAFPETDGMVTDKKGIFLGTVTADCLPVVFYEPVHNIVGVAHAGYKGILAGVIPEVILSMVKLGAGVEEIFIHFGPSICVSCYIVDENRADNFKKRFGSSVIKHEGSKYHLDLKKSAQFQLENCGILKEHIDQLNFCTSCNNDLFFSYRKDTKETYGEQVTVIGIL